MVEGRKQAIFTPTRTRVWWSGGPTAKWNPRELHAHPPREFL